MSDIFQMLGRGLITNFNDLFADELPAPSPDANIDQLIQQLAQDSDSAQLHLQIGMLYMDRRSYQQAVNHFTQALALQPDFRQAQLGLIFARIQLGHDDQAIVQIRSAIHIHGPDPQLCFTLAFCHERAGDVNAAVGGYQQVLQLDQIHSAARYRLAAIELRQSRFTQAIEHYQELHTNDPGSVFVLMSLGCLYLQTEQPSLALDMFQRALLIEPDNWQASDELADALEKAQLYDEAIEHVAAKISEQPEFADLYLRLAGLYAKAGQDQLAVQHFHKALRIHPNFLEAMVRLGAHHLRMKRFLEAAKCFTHAVHINDNLLLAYVGLGLSQSRLGQAEQAEQSFSMAASIEPNTTLLFAEMARLQLKHVLVSRGLDSSAGSSDPENYLLDQQITAHARYIAGHPTCADLHYRYGLLLRARSRVDEAIDHFRQALAINLSYPQAVIKLALALRQQSKLTDSAKLLCRALQIDPQSLELYYRLGLMYSNQATFALTLERFQSSLGDSQPAVDLQPNISLALQNMYLIDPVAASFNIMGQITAAVPQSLPVPG
ncbi:MAG: tetratricopeptide repeat protein [Actinobacteria bacterium]|nr:tetratricopeptide repeat protein [Actinomycetota bacterium]